MTSTASTLSKSVNWLIAVGFGAAIGGAVYCSTQSAPAKAALSGGVAAVFAVLGWKKQNAEPSVAARKMSFAGHAPRTPRM